MKSDKCYGLQRFLQSGFPITPSGSFRDDVRLFLEICCMPQNHNFEGMQIWRTIIVYDNRGLAFPLYIVEESVKHYIHPLCHHCQHSGWNDLLVSKRNYHFIIPSHREWDKRIKKGVLDVETHILHGVIHCNGFGHLLSVNGIEGGSKSLCGSQVMDIWECICTSLHTRKISVVDTSKKRNMDLRLLYGVSHGHTWFGRWEYKFCHESFGVSKDTYKQALEILSSLELDIIIQDMRDGFVKEMICLYRELCDTQLVTTRDLFKFMLELNFLTPPINNNIEGFGRDIYKDVKYLYQRILLDLDSDVVQSAVMTVLDSTHFTKEWSFTGDSDTNKFLRFIFRVIPTDVNLEMTGLHKGNNSVGEHLVVPLRATIRDVKDAAENAMCDMYYVMENLKVTEIVGLEGLDDKEMIIGKLESGSEILVRVSGVHGVVNCKCGAKGGDGERMVACHRCQVWQHTRCCGIDDDSRFVPLFVLCCECRASVM